VTDFEEIIASLSSPASSPLDAVGKTLPRAPGLYALHGDAEAWGSLGLGVPSDGRPLHVGKSQSSIAVRVAKQHFNKTQASSPRRSFAALLRTPLDLHPYLPYPGKQASYGLLSPDEARLTDWMALNLRIACWITVDRQALKDTENMVIDHWVPPLNLDRVTPWMAYIKTERDKTKVAGRAATRC
jgi:hypothetical protein